MDDREKAALELSLQPMGDSFRTAFIKAIMLRCDFYQLLAVTNGAEPEDYPRIIADAIESAQPIANKFLDDVSEIKRAQQFAKGITDGR